MDSTTHFEPTMRCSICGKSFEKSESSNLGNLTNNWHRLVDLVSGFCLIWGYRKVISSSRDLLPENEVSCQVQKESVQLLRQGENSLRSCFPKLFTMFVEKSSVWLRVALRAR